MGAEHGLPSSMQLNKLAQNEQEINPSSTIGVRSWMLNPKQAAQDDNDSWELRAFAEDTGNIEGATWPPRSYTCTICRKEFRSAQALGGHMNVHRHDRARLHLTRPGSSNLVSPSTLLVPNQKMVTNGELCVLCVFQNPNRNYVFTPTIMTGAMDPQSPLLSNLQNHMNNLISPCPPSASLPVTPYSIYSSRYDSTNSEPSMLGSNDSKQDISNKKKDIAIAELDLELRLGRSSSPS